MTDSKTPRTPHYSCARCHRSLDPYDPNARRNRVTRKWEHVDCRTTPRRSDARQNPTKRL